MLDLTQNDYNAISNKTDWHTTTVSLIKKHYNLSSLKHTDICDMLVYLGIELDKRDAAYYIRHKNPIWVSNWKSKISQARKDEWSALSEDEYNSRGQKFVQNLLNYRKNISSSELIKLGQSISSSKIANRDSMTPEQLKTRYEKMSAGWLKNGIDKKQERIAKIKNSCWDSLTVEERLEKCFKTSKHLKSRYGYVNEKGVYFDSSWEELAYDALTKYGIDFRYTNTDKDKNILKLNHKLKATWKPDFILEEYNLILEVKGFPIAYKKFFERDLPAFKESKYSKLYSIYLIDFPINATHITFEILMKSAVLCHSNCVTNGTSIW